MRMRENLIRSLDARCLPCFALDRERAHVAPHDMLQLVVSVATATGVREEFTCGTCGQRMVRFLAKQISPPPSNVWRTERSSAQMVPAVADPPAAGMEDPVFDPDLEDDVLDEPVPLPPVTHEGESSYVPPEL